MSKEIQISQILTQQEHNVLGSTSMVGGLKRDVHVNPYIPEGVILGEITPEQAREERERLGFVNAAFIGLAAGLSNVVMRFVPLNPETYETVHDPEFGVLDDNKRKVESVVGEVDINRRVYECLQKSKTIDFFLRESSSEAEQKRPSSKEKK